MGDTSGIHLRAIDADTVRAVTKLAVRADQNRFVASNAVSLAQALFAPEAWYRAVHDGETLVGFVMLWDESITAPDHPDPRICVWRLMVDAAHQRRGIGERAMELVIAHVREHTRASKLLISHVPEEGGPEPLYRALGFVPTGEIDDGEVVMALPIAR